MPRRFAVIALALIALVARGVWADPLPERITIATWNLEWFFDHYTGDNVFDLPKQQSAPSRAEWEWRLGVTAEAIAKMNPTILCLQEVESRNTVFKLVKKLREEHKINYTIAFVPGTDAFTEQNVAVLAQSGLVEFGRREQSKEMFKSKQYYNLAKHIFCTFEWGEGEEQVRLTLLNVHMRAQPEATDLRIRQARLAHRWLADKIRAGENVVLIGDTNTEFTWDQTTPETDTGVLRGMHTDDDSDDLFDVHEMLKPQDRPTHIIHKSFDRILISPGMRTGGATGKGLRLVSVANRKDLNTRGEKQDEDHWGIYW
jgi:endonuclease/exonuclease/phosphatase family metal-dependent hydrolase